MTSWCLSRTRLHQRNRRGLCLSDWPAINSVLTPCFSSALLYSGKTARKKERRKTADRDDRSPRTALSCASSHKSYMPLRHGAILYSNDQHVLFIRSSLSPMIPLFKQRSQASTFAGKTVRFCRLVSRVYSRYISTSLRRKILFYKVYALLRGIPVNVNEWRLTHMNA